MQEDGGNACESRWGLDCYAQETQETVTLKRPERLRKQALGTCACEMGWHACIPRGTGLGSLVAAQLLLTLKLGQTLVTLCSVSPERKPGHRTCMGAMLPCKQVYELSHGERLRAWPDAVQLLQEHLGVRSLGMTLGQNRLVKAREGERGKLQGTQA